MPEEEVEKRLDKRDEIGHTHLDRHSASSKNWLAGRSPEDHAGDRRTHRNLHHDSWRGDQRFWHYYFGWFIAFRDIASPTNQRTSIFVAIPGVAVSNKAPIVRIESAQWLQAFRRITNATNERTVVSGNISPRGVGESAPVTAYEHSQAIASALVLANLNSLTLDWAARLSVGGVNMNFFIVKQLPVLPPEDLPGRGLSGDTVRRNGRAQSPRTDVYILRPTGVCPRSGLRRAALSLGRGSPPPPQVRNRRYLRPHVPTGADSDLEWILDAPAPSSSFPGLKRSELQEFGEYRTQRYVLQAYDQLAQGELPNLEGQSK